MTADPAANTAQPFEQMDVEQQSCHMSVKHKVDVGAPMVASLTERHARRHEVDLDVDHTHAVRS